MTAPFRYLLLFISILLGTVLVLYLSWLPDPDFKAHWYFPTWLMQWTNKHGQLRTAVPFLLLGFLIELFLNSTTRFHQRVLIWFGLLLIVTLAEVGQLFLPNRHFDCMDIFYGGAGAALGIMVANRIVKLFRKH